MDYDYLDSLVRDVAIGQFQRVGVLSTGEKLYIALAANSCKLLEKCGYTIVEAMARLGETDLYHLMERWRYLGNPKNH